MSKSGTYTSCYTYVVLQVGKFYLTDRSVHEIYSCIPVHTEFTYSCIHMVWKSGNWIYMSTYVWNIQVYNIHLIWMLKWLSQPATSACNYSVSVLDFVELRVHNTTSSRLKDRNGIHPPYHPPNSHASMN